MKKFIVSSGLAVALTLSSFSPVFAASNHNFRSLPKERVTNMKLERNDLRNDTKEFKQSVGGAWAKAVGAKVTAISGTTLTVSQGNSTYTVNTDSNTVVARHFWGTSSVSEISVGDLLNIYGQFTDAAHTTILAHTIRDLSITKREGVYMRTVTSKGTNTLTVQSDKTGTETVTVSSSTKIYDRTMKVISFADIQVGDKIRVRGVRDTVTHTFTSVSQIKDFSIPTKVTTTPTP